MFFAVEWIEIYIKNRDFAFWGKFMRPLAGSFIVVFPHAEVILKCLF